MGEKTTKKVLKYAIKKDILVYFLMSSAK